MITLIYIRCVPKIRASIQFHLQLIKTDHVLFYDAVSTAYLPSSMWQNHVENNGEGDVMTYLKAYPCIRLDGTLKTN
jgi:hypothetical protein